MFEGIFKNLELITKKHVLIPLKYIEHNTLWATVVCSPFIFKNLVQRAGPIHTLFVSEALICRPAGILFAYTPNQELSRLAVCIDRSCRAGTALTTAQD